MAYGRVVNVECKSKEDLIVFRNKWSKWWPDKVHNALSRTSIGKSENSLLLLATYETEKIADEAKAIIETFLTLWQSMCIIYSHFTAR